MFWDIVIISGVFWIIMSIFSFIQTVQVKNIYKMLEPDGCIYFGKNASFLRTKYIAFSAVNGDGKVQNAKLLKVSRIITIPKIKSLDYLIDQNLFTVKPESLNLDVHAEHAVRNLIKNYKNASEKKKTT